jgi:hypothetical protein
MDSGGSSRRSSACSIASGFDGIDTCGLEDEQVGVIASILGFFFHILLCSYKFKIGQKQQFYKKYQQHNFLLKDGNFECGKGHPYLTSHLHVGEGVSRIL